MPSIRKTKTSSGATAVQVVRYKKRKVVVMKHIGSGRTEEELAALVESATSWIAQKTQQQSLFAKEPRSTLSLATAQYTGVTHCFAHHVLNTLAERLGFAQLENKLFLDLVYMRIFEPSSKLRAIILMKRYFDIRYTESTVYRTISALSKRKTDVEKITVKWALKALSSDLSIVLYDVTTLYFETFEADELRVPGFSKDNKSQQPQIVVGLLVTREGFPLGYEVFKGNTFEGKTMIPVIKAFADTHDVPMPIVVADAAMISSENVSKLTKRGCSYIVGARLANCSPMLITQISNALEKKDGATMRISTAHGDLICAFSVKRYRKDKLEMDRQLARAEILISKAEPGKRAKFVKKAKGGAYTLNQALHAKAASLLGIKGYYTNLPKERMNNDAIIERYRDLWHVEAAFRMSKSDLATRPIFHRSQDAVKAHVLICFAALAIGKYMELQTKLSLRRIVDLLWSVTEAHIIDISTKETFTLPSKLHDDVRDLLKKLAVSY